MHLFFNNVIEASAKRTFWHAVIPHGAQQDCAQQHCAPVC